MKSLISLLLISASTHSMHADRAKLSSFIKKHRYIIACVACVAASGLMHVGIYKYLQSENKDGVTYRFANASVQYDDKHLPGIAIYTILNIFSDYYRAIFPKRKRVQGYNTESTFIKSDLSEVALSDEITSLLKQFFIDKMSNNLTVSDIIRPMITSMPCDIDEILFFLDLLHQPCMISFFDTLDDQIKYAVKNHHWEENSNHEKNDLTITRDMKMLAKASFKKNLADMKANILYFCRSIIKQDPETLLTNGYKYRILKIGYTSSLFGTIKTQHADRGYF